MGNGHREGERILVCLSPSPSNPKVIQAAAKLASAFSGTMTALFVETPSYSRLAEEVTSFGTAISKYAFMIAFRSHR